MTDHYMTIPLEEFEHLHAEIKRLMPCKVAVEAIRMMCVDAATDDKVDPRYTLITIGRILHNMDNVVRLHEVP